jgi:hypothetical protein
MQGKDVPSSWVRRCHCLVVVVSAPSPRRPWPSCSLFPPREQLLATAVEGPHPRPRPPLLPSSSWSSHSWGCWVVARCSIVGSLPVVVVGMPPGHAAPRPASSCSQRRLAFVVLSFHPRSAPRTVASSGSGGRCFSPLFSSCSPFPPCEQGLAAMVWA